MIICKDRRLFALSHKYSDFRLSRFEKVAKEFKLRTGIEIKAAFCCESFFQYVLNDGVSSSEDERRER